MRHCVWPYTVSGELLHLSDNLLSCSPLCPRTSPALDSFQSGNGHAASSPALDSLQCRSLASSRPPRGIRISTAHNSSPFSGLTSSRSPLCLCDSSTAHHSDALTASSQVKSIGTTLARDRGHVRLLHATSLVLPPNTPHPVLVHTWNRNVFEDQCVTPKCNAYTLALLVNFPTRAYFGCYGYSINVPHYHAKLDSPSHYGIVVAIITHVMLYRYHPAPMQSKKSSPSLLILTFLLGQTQCRYSWLGEH